MICKLLRIYIMLFCVLSFSSCKAILVGIISTPIIAKPLFGFKNVDFVKKEKVISFARKNHVDTTSLTLMDNMEALSRIGTETKVYNKDGYSVQIETGACYSPNLSRFTNVHDNVGFNVSMIDSSELLGSELMNFRFTQTYSLQDTISQYDLILLVPFSTWMYRQSKKNIKEAISVKSSLSSKKVKIIYQNLDLTTDLIPADSIAYYRKNFKKHTMKFNFD